MSRRHWALAVWLLAFFKLLWAMLPGLPGRRGVLFKRTEEKRIKVFDPDGNISQVFSPQITRITVQEVKPLPDGKYIADGKLLLSKVRVEITEPDTAELRGLNPDTEALLLKGSGQIAVVTGVVKEGKFEVEKEFLGKGTGRGAWEIKAWEK